MRIKVEGTEKWGNKYTPTNMPELDDTAMGKKEGQDEEVLGQEEKKPNHDRLQRPSRIVYIQN